MTTQDPVAPPPPPPIPAAAKKRAVRKAAGRKPVVNPTPAGAASGVATCAQCGASEVRFASSKGTLTCGFCHYEWSPPSLDEKMGLSHGIGELRGTVVATATADITSNKALVTLECTGCGAEVVINTEASLQARCHWCRHTLSLNDRIANGAVPDGILPFTVSKEQAVAAITRFAGERSFFQHRDFRKSFQPENVMGVYLPHMTVDGNVTVRLDGVGEDVIAGLQIVSENEGRRVNQFTVVRKLRLLVDDVVVTTASDKASVNSTTSTNNIINAVLPYDVKNMVRFDANYLGLQFNAEKRDMDVDKAEGFVFRHFLTIARAAVQQSVGGYKRGVRWESEQLDVVGSRWTSVLLPVWIYGFVELRGGVTTTHYVAVNGRSGAAMGSIPIDRDKALWAAWLAAIGSFVAGFVFFWIVPFLTVVAPLIGWGLYVWINWRYRNRSARYKPENVVAQTVSDLKVEDAFLQEVRSAENYIQGRNDLDLTSPSANLTVTKE